MKLRNNKTGLVIDTDNADIKFQSGKIIIIPEPIKLNGLRYAYRSISKLKEDWEDYTPAKPLIKDEKIRKAVRAWAEANNSTKMVFDGYHLASDEHGNDIEFSNSWAENVKHGEWYTVTELCGEENE